MDSRHRGDVGVRAVDDAREDDATVAVPGGGFVLPFVLAVGSGPAGTIGPLEAFVLGSPVVFGLATAIYLGIRLRRHLDERVDINTNPPPRS
jgi:hypothetical protein